MKRDSFFIWGAPSGSDSLFSFSISRFVCAVRVWCVWWCVCESEIEKEWERERDTETDKRDKEIQREGLC